MTQPTYATVIADASFCGRTPAAGWAAWVVVKPNDADQPVRIKRSGPLVPAPASPTIAELMALVNGISMAVTQGATHVLAQTDCLSVVEKIAREKGKSPEKYVALPPEIMGVQIPQALLDTGVVVKPRWVKGHHVDKTSRSWVNDWCDKQARKHMEAQRHAKK